jgi:hypothetical protein
MFSSIPDVIAKDCYESKQHFATSFSYDSGMAKKNARQALATNLKRLMGTTPALSTGKKIQAKTSGRVVQRTVSNMVRADKPNTNAPTLDNIEEVAKAFGLEAWELLVYEDAIREKVVTAVVPGLSEHVSEITVPTKGKPGRKRA